MVTSLVRPKARPLPPVNVEDLPGEFGLLDFVPTPEQWQILKSTKRFILVTGGEQSGKSTIAEKYLLSRFGEPERPGLFWLVGEDYLQTEKEFSYALEDLTRLGLKKRASSRVDPGYILLTNGTKIETRSAKDPQKLTRDSPDGIIACEAGQMSLETYRRLNSRVARSRGWVFLCGTLESSQGWFASLKTAWSHPTAKDDYQSFSLPTPSNTYAFPGGWDDPEILRVQRDNSDDYFMERLLGEVVPPKGRVFHEFRPDIHVVDVVWEGEQTPVYLWEDPGYGSSSAHAIEVAQVVMGQVQVFDEIYLQGLITKDIIDICKTRPWWKSPKSLVTDPHYKDQHHSMSSVADVWLAETGLVAGGERMHILPGIERLKSFLKPDPATGRPQIVFSPKCQGLLSEFGMVPYVFKGPDEGTLCPYSWRIDRDGRVVGEVPEDKFDHALKAIWYGLVWQYGHAKDLRRSVIKVHHV